MTQSLFRLILSFFTILRNIQLIHRFLKRLSCLTDWVLLCVDSGSSGLESILKHLLIFLKNSDSFLESIVALKDLLHGLCLTSKLGHLPYLVLIQWLSRCSSIRTSRIISNLLWLLSHISYIS